MSNLFDRLTEYSTSSFYPFHMPGHKRNMPDAISHLQEIAKLDITEIDGFDDLHQPEEVLREAQERAAGVFGADETYFLVNGSSAGILTAISAGAARGSRVIVARNCHKSVYHGLYLRELDPVFIYPNTVKEYGIADAIRPEQIEEAFSNYPDAAAVILTSPTYDGVVSDIGAIAKITHQAGAVLIVDAAHGAHFGFSPEWPESPLRLGADLVIQSLHKTLPALTQTALLHVKGKRVSRDKLRQFERVYQTTSPSYLLMGSIDSCVDVMEKHGREIMREFSGRLEVFFEKTKDLKHLNLMNRDILQKGCMKDFDQGKLLIISANAKITGNCLYKELLKRYYLQMEMACDTYVTAIATPWDTAEGLDRLADALLDIDQRLEKDGVMSVCATDEHDAEKSGDRKVNEPYPILPRALPLHKAAEAPTCKCLLSEAVGRIAGTYVNLYPPGIPLIIPGEVITEEVIKLIYMYGQQKLNVQGVERVMRDDASFEDFTITLIK